MTTNNTFTGFPTKTLKFLRSLRADNNKEWFDAHRADYEAAYVEPAKAFATALAPGLTKLAPVAVEARINGSIRRIHRDTRFSNNKAPYKDHLDFSFWEGERHNEMSSFFVRVSPDHFAVGAGFQLGDSKQIKAFRAAIADSKCGKELAALVKKLRRAGHELGGSHYKRLPKGFTEDGPAAELLLHNGLFVAREEKAAVAQSDDLVKLCLRQWKALLPLHRWLIDRVETDR